MAAIIKINLHNLRNNEHFQIISDTLAIVAEATPAALKVTELAATLKAAHDLEDLALKKIAKSALTAKIKEADSARRKLFRSMVNMVRALRDHFTKSISEAAIETLIPIDTYGNIAKIADAELTAALFNLIKDLKADYAEQIVTLGILPMLNEIERLNNTVIQLMDSRYDEISERSDLVLKDVRLAVDEAWLALCVKIDALNVVEDEEIYEDFIRKLNAVIERAKNIVAQRRGKAKAKKDEDKKKENPTEPEEETTSTEE